jgi:hypothetical protein
MELCLTLAKLSKEKRGLYQTLKERCEKTKCGLSTATPFVVSIYYFLPSRMHMDVEITGASVISRRSAGICSLASSGEWKK